MEIRIANGPVSWGVDMPDTPDAPPWKTVFSEIAQAGYRWCELGPEGYLPDEILWRQKEQFSDGVGYSWIDSLKEHAEAEVSDAQMSRARFRFALNPPATKEAYLYRSIFESHFPTEAAVRCVPEGPSIACSTPTAIAWDEAWAERADPSGRAVSDVHKDGL